jgi:hypothetical protein
LLEVYYACSSAAGAHPLIAHWTSLDGNPENPEPKLERQWYHENNAQKNPTSGSYLPIHLFGLAHDASRFDGADGHWKLAKRADSSLAGQ